MKRLDYSPRLARQIHQSIKACELDLTGLTVMTETASGAFVMTPLIAAAAGALVLAFIRDSSYGRASEIAEYTVRWAADMGVERNITILTEAPADHANKVDIVTNLGFVRPISANLIQKLPPHAVIALMYEPWEFRTSDIDAPACAAAGIPIIGTRETDSRLHTFHHVGALVLKLLLEKGVAIHGSRIVLIGSEPFESITFEILTDLGANVTRAVLPKNGGDLNALYGAAIDEADALVLVEHKDCREIVGNHGGIRPDKLAKRGVILIHVCGNIDYTALQATDLGKWPERQVPFGTMTVTTDYVGPRPVIDLHCAGLRVAESAVRMRLAGKSVPEAVAAAEATGLGLRFDIERHMRKTSCE